MRANFALVFDGPAWDACTEGERAAWVDRVTAAINEHAYVEGHTLNLPEPSAEPIAHKPTTVPPAPAVATDCPVCNASEDSDVIAEHGMCETCRIEAAEGSERPVTHPPTGAASSWLHRPAPPTDLVEASPAESTANERDLSGLRIEIIIDGADAAEDPHRPLTMNVYADGGHGDSLEVGFGADIPLMLRALADEWENRDLTEVALTT